jgi:hypothetical protein
VYDVYLWHFPAKTDSRRILDAANRSSIAILAPQLLAVNFDNVSPFRCPVFIFAGKEDRTTPSTLAETFYNHSVA